MGRALIEQWVRSENKGPLATFATLVPSLVFSTLVKCRNRAYDRGWLTTHRSPIPVISVGNLVVGGAGKTSLVALIAKQLGGGAKVALISHGYLARQNSGSCVVSRGKGPCVGWQQAGDEAYLLACEFPEAIVISGRDRVHAVQMAHELRASVAILDDGLQHRRLQRHLEVIVVDSDSPLGGGHFLPWGSLRDEPSRLQTADLIVTIGAHIPPLLQDKQNVVRMMRRCKGVVASNGASIDIQGQRVALFAGIGNWQSFERMVDDLGGEIALRCNVGDHRAVDRKTFFEFARRARCQGATLLVVTEKDWIKLASIEGVDELPIKVVRLQVELVLADHFEVWDMWIEKMKGWL